VKEQLSKEEIDTLLSSVDSGDVDTTPFDIDPADVEPYDLGSQDRITRGRIPTLDIINERFIRSLRVSMFNMIRRETEITATGVKMLKFSEYLGELSMPMSLNLIDINPLRGTGLCVIKPELVFSTVDNFFGGDGRYQTRIEEREFTPTENRVVQLLLDMFFTDMSEAWNPVMELDFKFQSSEVNPQFANIVNPADVVVISSFKVDINNGAGEFDFVMPYSMLEPIREVLDAGIHGEKADVDKRWVNTLKQEMTNVVVGLNSSMAHTKLTIAEVLNLNNGDVIPIEMPDLVTVRAADVPIFRGVLGNSNGKNSVQFVESIARPDYSND
jgi:flagellar motor switch protein FliM